jgi:hypothetical protein
MQALSSSHSKLRAGRIAKLRAELAALEGNSDGIATANGAIASASVKPKYRNPATGEVWSRRGRMAGWLAAKVKADESATVSRQIAAVGERFSRRFERMRFLAARGLATQRT